MAMKESFYAFLLSHLEFTKTTAFPEESVNNDDDDTMVMNENKRRLKNTIFNFLFL